MTAATEVAYEVVIGLEVHAQLLTHSKMFCGCSAEYAHAAPNSHVCPICMGMPGVLPVINRQAVEYTIMTGLALHCSVPEHSKFDRKNYPYPDLMKGYQISQYDMPLCLNGYLTISTEAGEKRPGITRVHLEEDTATSKHFDGAAGTGGEGDGYSLIDVNRAGCALMEIVGEPDLRSSEEARQYLIKLQQILRYIGVSKANMEEGNFRCDANISLRRFGDPQLGAKVEIKNMNSFRSVARALEYEIKRQSQMLDRGERIAQETRGWVDDQARTVSQRSKEFAHDYRYFPEPDLPPLNITAAEVATIRAKLPELPDARRARFEQQYGLHAYDAELLTETRARADYYEAAVQAAGANGAAHARAIANWLNGDFARLLHAGGIEIADAKLTPQQLAELVDLIESGTITGKAAKDVFEEAFAEGRSPRAIVEAKGLTRISDAGAIDAAARRVIEANAKAVADYRSGKAAAINALKGRLMGETKGRADPALAEATLKRLLDEG
ncbi:MAG TPA: Asp-tRNA(Asn)/Glu-tRNA(Gln) amidotransferase subunit GatB [Dehalococcoidia bacterium]|nr:Asp-tRNA(Asn)/Glu-tRNA(Gln) amidotransferase subunit GatB [Dehalococcoidia bacterium]